MLLRGLILTIAEDRRNGHFRRLGVFDFDLDWTYYQPLLELFPQEELAPPNMLVLFMKEKEHVALPDESSFGDVISNEDMKGCNLMEIPSLKGIQLYNITLI